jgi:hypothetical protein
MEIPWCRDGGQEQAPWWHLTTHQILLKAAANLAFKYMQITLER